MSYDDQIIKYLVEPANIEIALDVADYVPRLKEHLESKFWDDLRKNLITSLKSEENNTWRVEKGNENMKDNYFGLSLSPTSLPIGDINHRKYLSVAIQKEASKMFMGIKVEGVTDEGRYDDIKQNVWKLKEKLGREGYRIEDAWWVCWKPLDSRVLTDNSVVLQISRGDYQEQMANSVWGLFKSCAQDLEQINKDLSAV